MKNWRQTSTRKAFAIHMALSIFIFSSLVLTMWFFWFPGELFVLDGGWQGLKIVALIDLVLGPALTLILFKPGKKSLLFDMSVVAAFQIAALAYGFHTTYQQRTLAIVHTSEGFNTLSAAASKSANQTLLEKEITPKTVREFDDRKPAVIGTVLFDKHSFGQYLEDLMNNYPEAHERSDFYRSIDESLTDIADKAMKADDIASNPNAEAIQSALEKLDKTTEDIFIVPYSARYSNGFALFDPEQKKILDYVPKEKSTATNSAETSNEEPKNSQDTFMKRALSEN